MSRPRDRASALGLLPRMEAMPRKDGLVSYRYHPAGKGKKPIPLGTDKDKAILKVLDLCNDAPTRGTINNLWRLYQESTEWADLAIHTQADYKQCAKHLLKTFGGAAPSAITPQDCARYLRVERKAAPVRANREMALLSNLLNLAVERGDLLSNPCKQVRRNKERPRKDAPTPETLMAFLEWAGKRKGQAIVLAGMAEFAALSGNRRVEFLELHWPQVGATEVRLIRGKQREKQVIEVVSISPALENLLERLLALAKDSKLGAVFPTRMGNPYTEQGFKAMWSKLIKRCLHEGAIDKRFTFHDLRSYHVTEYKKQTGTLPDLHANPGTTARVYDRTKVVRRNSL